jgi:phytoene desaturase
LNVPKAIVIGSGFSGISAATALADKGFEVTVLEKNASAGGRARVFEANGFKFDMGPSWYWMPEVFSEYFEQYGFAVKELYELKRLDPSYKVIFGADDVWDIPAEMEKLEELYERIEEGGASQLRTFLAEAKVKYELGMNDLVRKPALSWAEYVRKDVISGVIKTSVFKSLRKHVRDHFVDDRLRQLMEFPVLFLGAAPQDTPALYSLMNYADMALGTWYPKGGMGKVVEGFVKVAEAKGVRFEFNSNVTGIRVEGRQAIGVIVNDELQQADVVIASADYQHVDQHLLSKDHRSYKASYWDKRHMAPSSLLFYLGVEGTIPNIDHHNLFFDKSLDSHSDAIYKSPRWPEEPLFYANCTSKSDDSVSPAGHEALFLLIPLAAGLNDDDDTREVYYNKIMDRLEAHCEQAIRDKVVYKRSYCVKDFEGDYNAFKGNAYGMANTLSQTAVLRPSIKSKKVDNLFYAGQLTVPGPGVPPAIISGQLAAEQVVKEFKQVMA